jgi:hypothetical protein
MEDEKRIPSNTIYCYGINSIDMEKGIIHTSTCPYYEYGEDIWGTCKLDNSEVMDQVKNCDINMPDDWWEGEEDSGSRKEIS